MQWKLFADLAEAADGRTAEVPVDGDTVGDALDALLAARPALSGRVLTDDGELRDDVNLLRNGEAVDTDAPAEKGDELALFPPVSGGSRRGPFGWAEETADSRVPARVLRLLV